MIDWFNSDDDMHMDNSMNQKIVDSTDEAAEQVSGDCDDVSCIICQSLIGKDTQTMAYLALSQVGLVRVRVGSGSI